MKRREGDRAGEIDIGYFMLKYKQKVWWGFEGAETDNIRTLNA